MNSHPSEKLERLERELELLRNEISERATAAARSELADRMLEQERVINQRLDEKLSNQRLDEKLSDQRAYMDKCVAEQRERAVRTETLTDERIARHFKRNFGGALAVLTVMGLLGAFGLWSVLQGEIAERVGDGAVEDLNRMREQGAEALAGIEGLAADANDPLIVLQTDYGSRSPYMGALKGVIYSINPRARIETITADVSDFDVAEAAWTLWQASRFYPPNTIFVAITNPGGITTYPRVVVRTHNGHTYVGHDNGVFDFVVSAHGHSVTYSINSPALSPVRFNELFGGIDVFGPTAAHLSLGFDLSEVGPSTGDYQAKLPDVIHRIEGQSVLGTAIHTDKYGNVATNILADDLSAIGVRNSTVLRIRVGDQELTLPFRGTYGEVGLREPVALLYEGYLQLALNQGSFAVEFNVGQNTRVSVIGG